MNPPSILIIEDDDLQYEIYEEALAKYKLIRVTNGSEALADELKQNAPKYAEGVIITQVVPFPWSSASGVLQYRERLAKYHPNETSLAHHRHRRRTDDHQCVRPIRRSDRHIPVHSDVPRRHAGLCHTERA